MAAVELYQPAYQRFALIVHCHYDYVDYRGPSSSVFPAVFDKMFRSR